MYQILYFIPKEVLLKIKITWTDPGNDRQRGVKGPTPFFRTLVRTTKTMIIVKGTNHLGQDLGQERWRRKDGTNIDYDEDYFGWVISPKDLKNLNENFPGTTSHNI